MFQSGLSQIKVSSAKAKGKFLERLIKQKLIELFNFTEDDIRIPVGSEKGCDIKLSKKAQQVFPFKIEAKNRAKIGVYTFYAQATRHEGDGLEPLVIIKQNYKNPLAIIDLDYFLDIIKTAIINKKGNK